MAWWLWTLIVIAVLVVVVAMLGLATVGRDVVRYRRIRRM